MPGLEERLKNSYFILQTEMVELNQSQNSKIYFTSQINELHI